MTDDLRGARYSVVERRVWNDQWFREQLTQIPPCGAGLWLYLLTTPELGSMPGLIVSGQAALAEHLKWSPKGFAESFAELSREGRVKVSWEHRLLVIPNAITRRKPHNPNVVLSWHAQWIEVPECPLKVWYYRELKTFVESFGKGFAEAFAKSIEDPSGIHSPNQEQEQEQDLPLPPEGDEPEPKPKGSRSKPRTLIPEDWQPSPKLRAWAVAKGLTDAQVESETRGFVAYWIGEGKTKADWDATFRGRIDRAIDDKRLRVSAPSPAQPGSAMDADGRRVVDTSKMTDVEFKAAFG